MDREGAERLKGLSEVVGELAHDLRNSLNVVLSVAQLMEFLPPGDERRIRNLELLQRSTLAARDQIQNLVDVVRIEAGTFKGEGTAVDLHPILERLRRDFGEEDAARGVEVAVPPPPPSAQTVYGNAGRIRNLLSRVLANGVRAAGSGGRVRLTVEHAKDRVLLVVSNSGELVAPHLLPSTSLGASDTSRVSTPAAEPRPWSNEGLPLAAALARALGGEMRVESAPDVGNRVVVILPIAPPEDLWSTQLTEDA